MMRPVSLLALVLLPLAIVSCQKAPSAAAAQPPAAIVADSSSGFMVRSGQGLYDIVDGNAKWTTALLLGEKLALTGQAAKGKLSDGKDRDFVQVKRDSGTVGWARAEYVVSNALLAVVTADGAVVYKEPKNTAATGTTVPQMTVLAIQADSAGQAYIRVTWFDPVSLMLWKDVYVRNEGISTRLDDVESVILLQLAAASANETQKRALLDSAAKDYPGSSFILKIEEALAAIAASQSPKSVEKFFAAMLSTADKVNVRDAPDETAGKVLAQLSKGQKVDVEEKTTESYTVGDQTAPWYRIADPKGWVFGAFLGVEE